MFVLQSNILGELGRNSKDAVGDDPLEMDALTFISFTASLEGYAVVDIELGFYHACALLSSGSVVCWGENLYGATGADINAGGNVGDDVGLPMNQIVPITFKNTHAVVEIAAGHHVTCSKIIPISSWNRMVDGGWGD